MGGASFGRKRETETCVGSLFGSGLCMQLDRALVQSANVLLELQPTTKGSG